MIHLITAVSVIKRLSLYKFILWGRDLVSVVRIRESPYYRGFFKENIWQFVGTLETVRNRQVSVPKGSSVFSTDLPSNFWKTARLLGKIKNIVSLRFISLSFPIKKSSCERTWPYWQWIVCTMKKGNDRCLWSAGKNFNVVCCEDNYFPKGTFKSFTSLFHSA